MVAPPRPPSKELSPFLVVVFDLKKGGRIFLSTFRLNKKFARKCATRLFSLLGPSTETRRAHIFPFDIWNFQANAGGDY
jgi:hypothetical protein